MTSKCPHCGNRVTAIHVFNYPDWTRKWFWMSCENCHTRWYDSKDWSQHVVNYIGADKLNQIGYRENTTHANNILGT